MFCVRTVEIKYLFAIFKASWIMLLMFKDFKFEVASAKTLWPFK